MRPVMSPSVCCTERGAAGLRAGRAALAHALAIVPVQVV